MMKAQSISICFAFVAFLLAIIVTSTSATPQYFNVEDFQLAGNCNGAPAVTYLFTTGECKKFSDTFSATATCNSTIGFLYEYFHRGNCTSTTGVPGKTQMYNVSQCNVFPDGSTYFVTCSSAPPVTTTATAAPTLDFAGFAGSQNCTGPSNSFGYRLNDCIGSSQGDTSVLATCFENNTAFVKSYQNGECQGVPKSIDQYQVDFCDNQSSLEPGDSLLVTCSQKFPVPSTTEMSTTTLATTTSTVTESSSTTTLTSIASSTTASAPSSTSTSSSSPPATTTTTTPVTTLLPPPTTNFTVVNFQTDEGCAINSSSEMIGVNVYPFNVCVEKDSNNSQSQVSMFSVYISPSYIRATVYATSSNCTASSPADVEESYLKIGSCTDSFGEGLYTYLGDAPFVLPSTTSTSSSPSTSLTPSSSSTSSPSTPTTSDANMSSTTTVMMSSTSVSSSSTASDVPSSTSSSTAATTILTTQQHQTSTTPSPVPPTPSPSSSNVNDYRFVELAIYKGAGECNSAQETTVVYKTNKCYAHVADEVSSSFIVDCDSTTITKKYFKHGGIQECDENMYSPVKVSYFGRDQCLPYEYNSNFSSIYKCAQFNPNGNGAAGNDDEEDAKRRTVYIAAGAGGAVVLLIAFVVLFLIWKHGKKNDDADNSGSRTQRFEVQMDTSRHGGDGITNYSEVRPEV